MVERKYKLLLVVAKKMSVYSGTVTSTSKLCSTQIKYIATFH